MNRILIPVVLLVLVFAGAGYYFLNNQQKAGPMPLPQGQVCDSDTMVCEDGTVLKREGSNCDFPPCPSDSQGSPVSTSVPASFTPAPSASGEDITVSGTMICLPHKNTSGPQTLECAFGIKADDGNNYGLTFPDMKYMMGASTGAEVTITGKLTKISDSKYDSAGTIVVQSLTKK